MNMFINEDIFKINEITLFLYSPSYLKQALIFTV